jgi:hypothetical protein
MDVDFVLFSSGRVRLHRTPDDAMGDLVSVGDYAISSGDIFMWKSDRAEVVLMDSEEGWLVRHSTVGRLLGPPQLLHQARHRDAKLATWDVMARVQNATKNEAEMVRAGHSAVEWIKTRPRWNTPGGLLTSQNGTF